LSTIKPNTELNSLLQLFKFRCILPSTMLRRLSNADYGRINSTPGPLLVTPMKAALKRSVTLVLKTVMLLLHRYCLQDSLLQFTVIIYMAALWNRAGHYILSCGFLDLSFFFFFSSRNLIGCRLNVYHTSTHCVALVRCRSEINVLHAARWKYRKQK